MAAVNGGSTSSNPHARSLASPVEAMNGDAGAGPTTAVSEARASTPARHHATVQRPPPQGSRHDTERQLDGSAVDDDELLLPEDEADHIFVGQSRSVLPMSGRLCGIAAANEFIGGTTTRTLMFADEIYEEVPPDDEMQHTVPQQSECLRNSLSAMNCEGTYSAAPCPMRRGPALHDPSSQGQSETRYNQFLAPCPRMNKDNKGKDKDLDESISPRPHKRRTWKYHPPPSNDTDPVPIDVIDHESEVLVIRREPAPRPKDGCTIATSSFCQS